MTHRSILRLVPVAAALAIAVCQPAQAHHSFAMYDLKETYVFTGVVVRVDPNPNHLQLFFAPLNENRDRVLKDDKGEPIVWSVEMMGAAQEAKVGISVNGFPRGTIFSVGLHPLRNGKRAGGRRESGLFKCPANTPPPPGKHCDSVPGSTAHGPGVLPEPTRPAPLGEP